MKAIPFLVALFVAVPLLALGCDGDGDGTPSNGAADDMAPLEEYSCSFPLG